MTPENYLDIGHHSLPPHKTVDAWVMRKGSEELHLASDTGTNPYEFHERSYATYGEPEFSGRVDHKHKNISLSVSPRRGIPQLIPHVAGLLTSRFPGYSVWVNYGIGMKLVKLARPGDLPKAWSRIQTAGTNSIYRAEPYIVKASDYQGNQETEVAGHRGYELLGLPHVKIHGWVQDDIDHTASKEIPDVLTLNQLPHHLIHSHPHHFTPQHIAKILVGEWLMSSRDRNSGNYLFHRDRGIIPIDYSFIYHTGSWIKRGGEASFPTRRMSEAGGLGESWHGDGLGGNHFHDSAIHHFMDKATAPPIDLSPFASFLPHRKEIAKLAGDVGRRFGEEEAKLASAAVDHRFQALEHMLSLAKGEPVHRRIMIYALPHYASVLSRRYFTPHPIDPMHPYHPRFPEMRE